MTNPNDPYSAFTGLDQRNGQVIESVYARGLSAREHASIQLRVPNSGTPWLDEMIRASLRQEFAKAAMQGWLSTFSSETEARVASQGRFVISGLASDIASALIIELEKKL